MFDKLLSFRGFNSSRIYQVKFDNGLTLYYSAKNAKDAERQMIKQCTSDGFSFEGLADAYLNECYTISRYD